MGLHDIDDVAREFGIDLTRDDLCTCGHPQDLHAKGALYDVYLDCQRHDPGAGWACECDAYQADRG